MPRIHCHYEDCVFLEEGYCGAAAVEIEPDGGCLTYKQADDADEKDDEWDEDDFDDLDEDEDDYYDEDEEEDDLWDDDDDEY